MADAQGSSRLGHTRNKSATSAVRKRSSTKGPLDVDDDPLSASSHLQVLPDRTSQPSPSLSAHGRITPTPRSVTASPAASERRPPKDFSFLLRPDIYHPLTALNVPLPFRSSPKQPGPETPLEDLLAGGHFRAAAVAAVQELTRPGGVDPHDHTRIFRLLYARLACLTLIDATTLAAQEVKALEDLNNPRVYVDEATGEHLAPWELRVLNVRLQALGFGDTRRAVMSYHDLAREARERVRAAAASHDNSAKELWRERLHELGIRVAGALVEMDDLTGAVAHLRSLRDKSASSSSRMALSKALLYLQLGDVDGAKECAASLSSSSTLDAGTGTDTTASVILALCHMGDTEYEAALEKWQSLREVMQDEMVGVNAAVCLLYLGRLQEGRDILEALVESGHSSHTLLFNLATMYELCTDRHKNYKMALAERVAAMDVSDRGWEKTTADFKL